MSLFLFYVPDTTRLKSVVIRTKYHTIIRQDKMMNLFDISEVRLNLICSLLNTMMAKQKIVAIFHVWSDTELVTLILPHKRRNPCFKHFNLP